MSWYRTGTVAVTNGSTVVTGTGTMFAANTRTGDAFIGPDGKVYEVTNIPTESTISIAPPYLGSTASGQTYAISPMQGYVKESADRLRQAVDTYGDQLESLQPWATADTPAEARDLLELGSAAERDIGTGTANVPDVAQLNTRLGTTGNLGTFAQQNSNAIAATGGNINGTAIGATTRSTSRFTSVDASLGVKFGNAVNADPLVLNHYEPGVSTLSVVGTTSAGSATYNIRSCRWLRTGRDMKLQIRLQWTGHTGSGGMTITGIPTASVAGNYSAVGPFFNNISVGSGKSLVAYLGGSTAVIEIYNCDNSGGGVAATPIGASGDIAFVLHYEV